MNDKLGFETLAIHSGYIPEPSNLSCGVPIHRTSSYLFKDTNHAANLFALKELGNIYTRLSNPTQDVLEHRITELEGGLASVASSSGTSAIFNTVVTIAKSGDEIVAGSNLYGGTYTMFDSILNNFGIKTNFVDANNPINFEKSINKNTRLLYVETIGNPVLDFTDISKVAQIAHKHEIPLVVDGTFTTPYLLKTIDYGADIVINSLTKWIGGHGVGLGGIVTDSGNFDWTNPKFSLFNEPDSNYHGLRWAHDLPKELSKIAFALRVRTVPLRNIGACISPDNAWIFLQGLETLALRMERHCENAQYVAEFLEGHKNVKWVNYPGLKSYKNYDVAKKYLKKGFGGMVVFGVKGGYDSAVKLINSIKLFSHLANVGDAKSLILHPSSTSHSQLDKNAQLASGLTSDLIRLSIGIEDKYDLVKALDDALAISH